MPKGFLKPPEDTLEKRQLEMRQYDTKNEEQILSATAGVLQDLGFTLDESETPLGLVVASKNCECQRCRTDRRGLFCHGLMRTWRFIFKRPGFG
jgi:hypothetical protein